MQRLSMYLLAAASLFATAVSAQTRTTTVLFIGNANAWGGQANSGDGAILTYLRSRYGAANVTYQDTEPAGSVKAETVLGYDVVVLSSTPSSGRYRNILHDTPAPVVNMEEAVADNGGGEFSITAGRTKEVEVDHKITISQAHPITQGFPVNSTVQIMSGNLPGQEVWWSTGSQAPGAFSLAADDDTATNLFITCVEAGGTLLNSTKAPCRRVMFGLTDRTFNSFTAAGKRLFGQAIDWAAAECCGQTSNFGAGLAGRNGIPTLTASDRPVYGSTIRLLASNSSGSASQAMVIIGNQPLSVPFLGGTLLATTTLTAVVPMPVGGISLPVQIPNLGPVCGPAPFSHLFYLQVLQRDAAAPFGLSFTPGMRLEVGK